MKRALNISVALSELFLDLKNKFDVQYPEISESSLILNPMEAFNERLESVVSGKKQRVDYRRLVTREMKRHLPDFLIEKGNYGDNQYFRLGVSDFADLVLDFEKINMFGLGKAFRINFQVEVYYSRISSPVKKHINLFALFGADEHSSMIYFDKEDLLSCLDFGFHAVKKVLDEAIPLAKDTFTVIPDKILPGIEINGRMSSLMAYQKIKVFRNFRKEGLFLAQIREFTDLGLRKAYGPGMDTSGYNLEHGGWYFLFLNNPGKKAFRYFIGHYGGISSSYFKNDTLGSMLEIEESWIDSESDFRLARQNGLDRYQSLVDEIWNVGYELEHDPERNKINHPQTRISFCGSKHSVDEYGRLKNERVDQYFRLNPQTKSFIGTGPYEGFTKTMPGES